MTIVPPEDSSPFDRLEGSDLRWSTRDLQILMGYSRWENLAPALKRAMASARNEGLNVEDVFLRSQENPSEQGGRPREDYRLTRHAAYLLAMNGDPGKQDVADAQAYFARKTREAETMQRPTLPTNREMALMVIAEADRADLAEAKVKELEPAAKAWDVLASAEGDYSLREAALFLNRDRGISTGQNRLLRSIREFDMIDRKGVPYAKHATHLVERATSYIHPHTNEPTLSRQIRVTVQGLRYLHKRLGGEGPLDLALPEAS